MQLAKVQLKLDKFSEVTKFRVTPPELMVLALGHLANTGGTPIVSVELIGKEKRPRTATAEMQRLVQNYGLLKTDEDGKQVPVVRHLFGSNVTTLPQKFTDIPTQDGKFFGIDLSNLKTTHLRGPRSYAPDHGGIPLDGELDIVPIEDEIVDPDAPDEPPVPVKPPEGVVTETGGVNVIPGQYPAELMPPPPVEQAPDPGMTPPAALPQAEEPSGTSTDSSPSARPTRRR